MATLWAQHKVSDDDRVGAQLGGRLGGVVALVAFCAVACSDAEPDDTQLSADVESSDDVDDTGPADAVSDTQAALCQYRLVRIEDHGQALSGGAAEVDAIALVKQDGAIHYAESVVEVLDASGLSNMTEPSNLLGAPDISSPPDKFYYSLGGEGSYAVVDFGSEVVETGDQIRVFMFDFTGINECEVISVLVSNHKDGGFVLLDTGRGDCEMRIEVGPLPKPAGCGSAGGT